MNKEKLYEVNGVLDYAHCFSKEVMAKNPTDAKKKVEKILDSLQDSAIAEFQGGIVDLGIEVTPVGNSKSLGGKDEDM